MAIVLTSNFAGDFAKQIYKDLAEGNEVIAGTKWNPGSIAFLELDVPEKRELRYSTIAQNPVGAYVKSPGSGDTTVTYAINKRELNMEKHMIYERFSPEDFDFEWADVRSIGSQTEHRISPMLLSDMLTSLVPEFGAQLSRNFFEGDKASGAAGTDLFDGVFTKALADGSTLKATNAGVVTSANVFDVLFNVIDKIPNKDYNNDKYAIMVSNHIWRNLQRANSDVKKATDGVLNDSKRNLLEEFRILPYNGLADNHAMCTKVGNTPDSNLHFGFWFDPSRETNDIRIGRVAEDSEEWFLRVNIKLDANYKYSPNIITYNGI